MKKLLCSILTLALLCNIGLWGLIVRADYTPDEYEPNNSFDETSEVLIDYDTFNATISSSTDLDYYEHYVGNDEYCVISMTNIPSGCDYQIYAYRIPGYPLSTLYPLTGYMYAGTSSGSGSTQHLALSMAGAYILVIGSPTGTYSAQPYTVTVFREHLEDFQPLGWDDYEFEGANSSNGYHPTGNNYLSDAVDITSTVYSGTPSVSANLHIPCDVDWYKFDVASEQQMQISLTTPANCSYYVALYNASGDACIGSDTNSVQETLSAGTYNVAVYSIEGYSSTNYYTLSFSSAGPDQYEPNDSYYESGVDIDNTTIYANLDTEDDVDFFTIPIPSDKAVYIGLSDIPDGCIYTLELYRRTSNNVYYCVYKSENGDGIQSIQGEFDAGEYFVKVSSLQGCSYDYYTLSASVDKIEDDYVPTPYPAPVGYWSFNGNAADTGSIGGADGTLLNGATYASGISGQALYCDGSNDYVKVYNNYANFNNMNSFTLSAWVNPTTYNSCSPVINKVTPNRDFVLEINSSGKATFHFAVNYSTYYHCTSSVTVPLNTWTHLAVTVTSTAINLYQNGILAGTRTLDNVTPQWTGTDMQIGGFISSYFFPGLIDEVKIFNTAITQAQIAEEASALLDPEPIGYWAFSRNALDTGSIGTAHGTLVNGPYFTTWGHNTEGIVLDGNDDYIDIADNYSNFNGMTSFTISAWVKLNTYKSCNPIISKHTPNRDFVFEIKSSGAASFHFAYNYNIYRSCTSSQTVPLNTWTHLAAVVTPTQIQIYQNGTLVGTSAISAGAPAWTGGTMKIGGFIGNYFDGELDEVKIFNSALSAEAITRQTLEYT
ncbi:MAG: LamG domain-containing protein [Clostridia bacterium]|nr:LamG domain-containing protein [Clostridia bacterium]